MSNYSYLFKFIIVGDSNVGKSCLMLRFCDNKYKQDNDPTIGVEFGSRTLSVNEKLLRQQIWDTAGQESFRSITRSYFRGAIGCILCYDISNRDSYINLVTWLEETQACASSSIVIIVVGNKSDLEGSQGQVSKEEVEDFCRKRGLYHIQTSCKSGQNVLPAFEKLSEMIIEHIDQGLIDPQQDKGIKVGINQINELRGNTPQDKQQNKSTYCSC